MRPFLLYLCCGMVGLCGPGTSTAQRVESPVPDEVRTRLGLADFYQQFWNAGGLPVIASGKTRPEALQEAAWIVDRMLEGRDDLRQAMVKNKVRLVVMAHNEYTTDVPEHAHLKPKDYWDRRARGLGPSPEAPAVSCGEENLLSFPEDHYAAENILIHEFAHAIHQMALNTVDPTFEPQLQQCFSRALTTGRWRGVYAGTNPAEYWAEGVQSWFGNNRENDASHNHVNTRAELEEYDPELAALCRRVFGKREWTYRKPADRPVEERRHLLEWKAESAPVFRWRPGTEKATEGKP